MGTHGPRMGALPPDGVCDDVRARRVAHAPRCLHFPSRAAVEPPSSRLAHLLHRHDHHFQKRNIRVFQGRNTSVDSASSLEALHAICHVLYQHQTGLARVRGGLAAKSIGTVGCLRRLACQVDTRKVVDCRLPAQVKLSLSHTHTHSLSVSHTHTQTHSLSLAHTHSLSRTRAC